MCKSVCVYAATKFHCWFHFIVPECFEMPPDFPTTKREQTTIRCVYRRRAFSVEKKTQNKLYQSDALLLIPFAKFRLSTSEIEHIKTCILAVLWAIRAFIGYDSFPIRQFVSNTRGPASILSHFAFHVSNFHTALCFTLLVHLSIWTCDAKRNKKKQINKTNCTK